MSKELERNADWIARDNGRIPSKGARAAERASAGIGATDHDAELLEERVFILGARDGAKSGLQSPSPRNR
jgi:hypothetical protein